MCDNHTWLKEILRDTGLNNGDGPRQNCRGKKHCRNRPECKTACEWLHTIRPCPVSCWLMFSLWKRILALMSSSLLSIGTYGTATYSASPRRGFSLRCQSTPSNQPILSLCFGWTGQRNRVNLKMVGCVSRPTTTGVTLETTWCRSRSCSLNLKHLTLLCLFYLPQESFSVLIIGVYIPPHADTDTALSTLHDSITKHSGKYLNAALIVSGDFNKTKLTRVLPNLLQHISCPTRGKNTLDHCYTPYKDSY